MSHLPPPEIKLPDGVTLVPLLPAQGDRPFWRATPAPATADYADGLEDLIADYNRQPADRLEEWAQQHPLTAEQRFILEYNTSADRANVLRPLPLQAGDRVIEVGCGCGPVSQYLWSRCRTLSLEASTPRATAAAHRLGLHDNPHGSALVCADFYQVAESADFDWVIFNGVLEYAAVYSGAQESSPYLAMLQKAASFLKPGGRCVVTIENRLGLKYFAGAPEDHFGQPAVGLEGYRTLARARASIRTFSRPELARLMREAGFEAADFQFPFPDYKFTKLVVPDDRACWQFAADRLIDNSPAWRGTRAQHFDEPSVYRSLAAEGLAGDFANSFLAVASKPGRASANTAAPQIHYFPLRRKPSLAVGAVFLPVQHQVLRQLLSGGKLTAAHALPAHAPGNPRAGFAAAVSSSDRQASVQEISPVPTLWETLRHHIGSSTDQAADYESNLAQRVRDGQELYLATLPLRPDGQWADFLAKLRAEFTAGGLSGSASGVLQFLERQSDFAAQSLAGLKTGPWSIWAPDWIMENLFPAANGRDVRLFDVEYVDPGSCLPTPALVFRQLRLLQLKTADPALAPHWPWPARNLSCQSSAADLPGPLTAWIIEKLWGRLPPEEADRHCWFWTKVAEIIECAMIGTVVAPFTRAYETAPWLNQLSAELAPLAHAPLADANITSTAVLAATDQPRASAAKQDELIAKQQEINLLQTAATERLEVIHKLDTALNQARRTLAELGHDPTKSGAKLPALLDEVSSLHLQLEETRSQLQAKQNQLRKLEIEAAARTGSASRTFLQRSLIRWQARLAERAPHPLAKLRQYPPRPLRKEKFPRPAAPRKWPRLCVITPSYNQADYLERTMRSVLDQGYPNLAYGVQDGGSTDRSAEVVTRYIAQLAHAESQKDEGQADAIAKGFKKLYPQSDDIMGWLNSDDLLMPGTLAYVGHYFATHPEVDVIYGHRVIVDEQDREVGRWYLPRHHAHTLPWFDLVPQETLFWRARCFHLVGGMDPSFHFAMDWDLLLRFEQAGLNIVRVPYFLGCFRVHATQKTTANISTVGEEEMSRLRLRTHGRKVHPAEIERHLGEDIRRSALVAWLHKFGVRY
jgi:GT2 family glycosyltransferase/SAM-dependent methyltransferase/DNA-binding protein H-NS